MDLNQGADLLNLNTMHNNLKINRLRIITNNGKVSYDEKFQSGINIIRGDNSSGKSTISHFIFYVLGGSMTNWVDEALKCDYVIAEVNVNGSMMTIKRYVNKAPGQPMYITFNTLEFILDATSEEIEWVKYPYNTTTNKKSFSNLFFELLDIPIVYGDANITMHQLLRLLYVDQDSPTNSLFLFEPFDSSLTRQTIAELLLGVYQTELYDSRINKRTNSKKLEELENQTKALKSLVDNPFHLDRNYIEVEIENLVTKTNELNILIQELKDNKKRVIYGKKQNLEFQVINKEVIKERRVLDYLDSQIAELEYEINDTKFFIEMLQNKKDSIENSLKTKEAFQDVTIEYCPECLSGITPSDPGTCSLCKNTLDNNEHNLMLGKMLQEISFQIIESDKIKKRHEEQLIDLIAKKSKQLEIVRSHQIELNNSVKDVKSFREEKIDSLLVEKGQIEGQHMQFATLLEQADKYQAKLKEIEKLKTEIATDSSIIEHFEKIQKETLKKTSEEVEKFALDMLHSDLNREEGFRLASNLRIDYSSNSIYVNDKKQRFSASSNFYLKTVVRYAIFFASLEIENMRYPRFILCDNMEDNGIEDGRAKNFQNLIIQTASNYDKENYQLIYTTSFIPDELNSPEYCIGEFYSKEGGNKSLKHV
ncbi:AAA family ATPase [uncultured Nonlabens sp.]|uniref:AAA family ATPase n=1 Tax=uncultured Nonlabens sp. TaxID=859306 RepID=UPI002626650B|nr:AAA family ATPase [uncultured Nonlabens sp.]